MRTHSFCLWDKGSRQTFLITTETNDSILQFNVLWSSSRLFLPRNNLNAHLPCGHLHLEKKETLEDEQADFDFALWSSANIPQTLVNHAFSAVLCKEHSCLNCKLLVYFTFSAISFKKKKKQSWWKRKKNAALTKFTAVWWKWCKMQQKPQAQHSVFKTFLLFLNFFAHFLNYLYYLQSKSSFFNLKVTLGSGAKWDLITTAIRFS